MGKSELVWLWVSEKRAFVLSCLKDGKIVRETKIEVSQVSSSQPLMPVHYNYPTGGPIGKRTDTEPKLPIAKRYETERT